MFATIQPAPGDAILGLLDLYQADTNPAKVDLGVGVYRNQEGLTPILATVKSAEQWLIAHETSKSYTSTHGNELFNQLITKLVFGEQLINQIASRIGCTNTPGGSGAVRLAAEFIHQQLPNSRVWLPKPTWPNHVAIFQTAQVAIESYPYINADNQLDFESMMIVLKENARSGDILLLHGCCHNPSGFDLDLSQWQQVADFCRNYNILPFIDLAYQGLGSGLDEDAAGVRLLAQQVDELIVSNSCSKNFGIYNDRTAGLMILTANHAQRNNVHTQIASIARTLYSVPPFHGAAIVAHILNHDDLTAAWREEVNAIRQQIIHSRQALLDALKPYGLAERFNFITKQRGMFSYTGLTVEQVNHLQQNFSIYMLKNGRANIAGLQTTQIPYVAQAFASLDLVTA